MHDPYIKRYFSFTQKTSSVLAFILALLGHLYLLHRVNTFTPLDKKKIPIALNVNFTSFDATAIENGVGPQVTLHTRQKSVRTSPKQDHSSPAPLSTSDVSTDSNADEPYYYKSGELSSKPQVINDLPDDFALPALIGVAEPFIVTLRINREGTIDDVIIDGDITNADALQAIVTAFKTLRFTSAQISGNTVSSEMRITVRANPAVPGTEK